MKYSFAVTIGKGISLFLVFGLLSALSASGADLLQVASFSTVLTEIAQQVGKIFPLRCTHGKAL